jgi:hypothetical protein
MVFPRVDFLVFYPVIPVLKNKQNLAVSLIMTISQLIVKWKTNNQCSTFKQQGFFHRRGSSQALKFWGRKNLTYIQFLGKTQLYAFKEFFFREAVYKALKMIKKCIIYHQNLADLWLEIIYKEVIVHWFNWKICK